jgi:diaminopimelate decarboxylase
MDQETTTAKLDALLLRHAQAIEDAADRFGLPLHVIFLDQVAASAGEFLKTTDALYPNAIVAFAAKSNPCRGAIRAAAKLGLGLDAASEYEFRAGLEEGIDARRITCNGNAKSDAYIIHAIEADALIAVDNADEIDRIEAVSRERGRRPTVLVRFRGMPLAGLTSEDQTTASDWTKFGFHVDEAEGLFSRIRGSLNMTFGGISAHIGTQIADPSGYERLLEHFFALAEVAKRIGLPISYVNVGGGYPVRFLPAQEWEAFTKRLLARVRGAGTVKDAVTWNDLPLGFAHLRGARAEAPDWVGKAYWTTAPGARTLDHLLRYRVGDGPTAAERLRELGEPTLIVEPGRALIGPAGVTLTRVMGVKEVLGHPVVSLDMGINNHGTNLITPDIFPASVLPTRSSDEPTEAFLAGRLCFSGDMISKAKVRLNRLPKRGERFVLYQTGAYGADHFASNSCGFPRPGKVAVREDGAIEIWRRPERFEDVFGDPTDRLSLDE